MRASNYSQSFSRDALFRQMGPLIGAVLLLLVSSDPAKLPDEYSGTILWGAALIVVAVASTVLVPWHRLPRFAMLAPPLVYILVASGFGPGQGDPLTSWAGLFLLPVFWLSLYATGLELAAGVAAVAIALLTPMGSATPRPDPTQTFELIGLAAALGIGSHRLFDEMRARAGLRRLSRADQLTGVPNRQVWEAALSAELAEGGKDGVPTSVAMLNVDNFRAYNDRYGHLTGDRLLKFFTARWQAELRTADLLARFEGDTFAVLMPRCPLEAGGAVIRRLCSVPATTTTSAGVACWNGHESMPELITRAQVALSQAKQEGRSRIVLAETPPPPAPPRSPDNRTPSIRLEPTESH